MRSSYYGGLSLQNARKSNMDSLLLKDRVISGHKVCLAVVCDGVGSMADGAFAASYAVRMLIDWLDQLESIQRIGLYLRDCILSINRSILKEAQTRGLQTASTLSALLVTDGKYYIAHVGDSRIYSYQNNTLEMLTCDQVLDGKLAACLGRFEQVNIIYNEGMCENQIFLLCSDGFYKKMDMSYLQLQLSHLSKRSIKKTLENLTQFVVKRGEKDNISLALVICES